MSKDKEDRQFEVDLAKANAKSMVELEKMRFEHWRVQAEYEQKHAFTREDIRTFANEGLEMFKSVILIGQNAIRTMLILGGGSSAAVLAFLGHLFSSPSSPREAIAPALLQSLVFFSAALSLAALCSGLSYITQWRFSVEANERYAVLYENFNKEPEDKDPLPASKVGISIQIACIVLGFSSYGCFLWGCYKAYQAFSAGLAAI